MSSNKSSLNHIFAFLLKFCFRKTFPMLFSFLMAHNIFYIHKKKFCQPTSRIVTCKSLLSNHFAKATINNRNLLKVLFEFLFQSSILYPKMHTYERKKKKKTVDSRLIHFQTTFKQKLTLVSEVG